MSNNREYRVYVLDLNDTDFDTNGYEIEDWSLYEKAHGKLLPETEDFLKECEENGTVFSLAGFQNALNLEDIFLNNSWVYITNNY